MNPICFCSSWWGMIGQVLCVLSGYGGKPCRRVTRAARAVATDARADAGPADAAAITGLAARYQGLVGHAETAFQRTVVGREVFDVLVQAALHGTQVLATRRTLVDKAVNFVLLLRCQQNIAAILALGL